MDGHPEEFSDTYSYSDLNENCCDTPGEAYESCVHDGSGSFFIRFPEGGAADYDRSWPGVETDEAVDPGPDRVHPEPSDDLRDCLDHDG